MKLAVSNIAWSQENDETAYGLLIKHGFNALECAPTRFFPDAPYSHAEEMACITEKLAERGLPMVSMQSLLYGHPECTLFESAEGRAHLENYLTQAILFAERSGIRNLVFGNPKNRRMQGNAGEEEMAVRFFRHMGEIAAEHHCVLALEPNPAIYGGNYVLSFKEAKKVVQAVDHPGLRINFDLGCVIANNEAIDNLSDCVPLISHVHISEPMLVPIDTENHAPLIRKLVSELNAGGYRHCISLEMGCIKGEQPMEQLDAILSRVTNIIAP